ncbi:MAG: hypothetical protein Q7J25_12040 [Vicinamibacterales bacterium]|nr:hypothetical protein [Vicinamibacterales bacterium]
MTRACLTILLLLCSVRGGFAQQQPAPAPPPAASPAPAEPVYPVVRIGMVSYLQYAAELENRDGYNAFDVTRAYVNINGQLSRNVRFRFTPDVRRITDGSLAGTLTVRVKYAFMQLDNVGPARSWVRFGQHQSPWLDFEESVNRYRVQGTMFSEREGLIPGSADFGVSYFTPLPNGYGEIHGGVYNGEGYTLPEANKYKSFQGRLTVRPFPNRGLANYLRVSGFYNAGWYAADRPRRLGIAMVSYEHRRLVATIERTAATERPLTAAREFERSGWSAFIEPRQGPTGLAGIARVDAYDPDRILSDNSLRRVIVGGAYWLTWNAARLGLVATNEQVHYDAAAARPTENRLLLQTHVEF